MGFSEVKVWLVIVTATYRIISKQCTTSSALQKRWFYNPETQHSRNVTDVRVFDSNAKSLQRCYINNKKERKRQCNMRVLQVENEASHLSFLASMKEWVGKHQNVTANCWNAVPKIRRILPDNNLLDSKKTIIFLNKVDHYLHKT